MKIRGQEVQCVVSEAIVYAAPMSDVEELSTITWLGDEPMCLKSQAQAIIDQQAERIAELQLDADRYRWIEANSTYGIDYRQRPELTLPIYAPDHRDGLDAAIDAAMGSKGE